MFQTIKQLPSQFPVLKLYNLMKISCSGYYIWLKRPAKLIIAEQLNLYRRAKVIFEQSRYSLGYQTLRKRLCKEDFSVSTYIVQRLIVQLGLVFTQRITNKVITKSKYSDAVVDNLLNQKFNPPAPNGHFISVRVQMPEQSIYYVIMREMEEAQKAEEERRQKEDY